VSVASYLSVGGPAIVKQLTGLLRNPAIDALYGQPYFVADAGGFTVWKSGAMMAAVAVIWVALAATRLSRGAEDDGTFELLVLGSRNAAAVTRRIAGVLCAASLLAGAAVTAGFLESSLAWRSSALYGAGVALISMTFAGTSLVLSQLIEPRRLATAWSLALVGVAGVTRMVADGTSTLSALRWVTPFGWLEELRAFAHSRAVILLPWSLLCVALVIVAATLAERRDVGSGIFAPDDRSSARTRLLRGAGSFAWRQRTSVLVAWTVCVSVICAMIGSLLHSIVAFERGNASYRAMMQRYGFAQLVTAKGFIAEIELLVSIGIAFLALMSMHSEWSDESAGRDEIALSVGPSRRRWFLSSVAATVGVVAVVATVSSLVLALAATLGGASVSLFSVLVAGWNAAAVGLVVIGAASALHGIYPRATMGVMSAAIAASFVVELFGPALKWPGAVVDLSIFHHLAASPAVALAWTPLGIFAALGVLGVLAGVLGYERRDLLNA
jgi:ABC-2 type transport system permease protein